MLDQAETTEILLVDDDPRTLVAMRAILGDIGASLVAVDSGREALLRLLDKEFALVLLDVQMPGLDGFETAELIRSRAKTRHTPIIFLTAFNQHDSAMLRGYSLGAVDFLFKPIVPEILRSKVNVFVELQRKTQELQRQRLVEERQRWEAEQLARSNARLSLLSDTANRLLLGQHPRQLLGDLYQRLAAHLQVEIYANYFHDEVRGELVLDAWGGLPDDVVERIRRLTLDDGIAGQVARTRQRVVAQDLKPDDGSYRERSLRLRAYAAFPLLADRRLIGVLSFATRKRGSFAGEELATMQLIADQIAIALDRARLIDELQSRNAELAANDRRKDEFLAMLAHELRNPLAPIVNSLHIVGRQAQDEVVQRAHATMERQVRHLTRLVDDLLEVSRFTQGKIELRRERTDLKVVLEQALQIARPLIDARGHRLVLRIADEELPVEADVTRMAQVVSNLLNNAAKYTEERGTITLEAERGEDEVVVRVRDTGIGIAEEMLPRVFELFVQGEQASDRAAGGLGIGLTLVKRMVQMHGGEVIARSGGIGKGAELVVTLPLAETRAVASPSPGPSPSPSVGARALHILVIEDNADVRETLKELLELDGHVVTLAEDGPRGVELAGNGAKHDVALVDIGLPGLDGYAVAERLSAFRREKGSPVRLIAMSGYGQASDRRRALAAGFDAHLVKPVDPNLLTRLLAAEPSPPKQQGDA